MNTLRIVAVIVFAAATFVVLPSHSPAYAQTIPTNMSIFVAGGQSNMDGAAPLPASPPTAPRSWFLKKNYRWAPAVEPSHDPTNAVDLVGFESGTGSYSALTSFASTLATLEPSMNVGVVPRAKGATGLDQWACNASDQSLYGAMVKSARAASTMGTLAGLLWWQGENEAQGASPNPGSWAANFTAIVNCFRHDVYRPNLPVVFAQIRQTADPYNATVRSQQAAVNLSNVRMFDANTLTYQPASPLHADQAGYDLGGQKFAQTYESIVHPATPTPTPTATATATPAGGPSAAVTPSTFARGQTVAVSWSGLVNPAAWDFVAFYLPGAGNLDYCGGCWVRLATCDVGLDSTASNGATPASGSCNVPMTMSGLMAGTWQARLINYPDKVTVASTAITIT